MKKAISLLMALLIAAFSAVCLTGCKDSSERAAREAEEQLEGAKREAQRAQEEYDDIKSRADAYRSARDKLQ